MSLHDGSLVGDERYPRRSSRERKPMANSLDKDEVDREKLLRAYRSRGGFLGYFTRTRDALRQSIDGNQPVESVQGFLSEVEVAFDKFSFAHKDYLNILIPLVQSEDSPEAQRVADCEAHFLEMKSLLERSYRDVDALMQTHPKCGVGKEEGELTPGDSVSQSGSCLSGGSTSSARAKVAAKKAALHVKAAYLKKQQQLEFQQLEKEFEMKQQMFKFETERERSHFDAQVNMQQLEMEKDIEAAEAEESTLAKFVDGGVSDGGSSKLKTKSHGMFVSDGSHTTTNLRPFSDNQLPVSSAGNVRFSDSPPLNSVRRTYGMSDGSVPFATASHRPYLETHVPLINNVEAGYSGALNPMAKSFVKDDGDSYHDGISRSRRVSPVPNASDSESLSVMDAQLKMLDMLSLPKLDLPEFKGDSLQYGSFMNAFDSCVDKTRVDDGAKLSRLLQSCKGKAAEVLKPCHEMKPEIGYKRARQLLKERFGNEWRISQAWIKKISIGGMLKPNSPEALQDLADDVRGCIEALKALDRINDIDSQGGMLKIIDRLPLYLQSRWRRNAVDFLDRYNKYPNIEDLAKFLEKVAREVTDPIFGVAQLSTKPKMPIVANRGRSPKSYTFHAQVSSRGESSNVLGSGADTKTRFGDFSSRTDKVRKCFVCEHDHMLRSCPKLLAMSPSKRLEFVKGKRLCFNCLETRNHSGRFCVKPSGCNKPGCTGKHCKLLHDALVPNNSTRRESSETRNVGQEGSNLNRQQVTNATTSVKMDTKVALPVVSVFVRGGGNVVRTQALLDPGSNRTFCSMQLLDKLKVNGVKLDFDLKTLNDSKDVRAEEVSFEVSGKNKHSVKLYRVLAVKGFPVLSGSVANADNLMKWEHLSDVDLPDDSDVQLLIGQDHPHLLKPLEVRCSDECGPYAVRTSLGWTINGPLHDNEVRSAHLSGVSAFIQADIDSRLDVQVERFWKVDQDVTSERKHMSVEDQEVLRRWDESTCLKDGHYEVPIPFRHDPPKLPDNKAMANKRLKSLGKRLDRDPSMKDQYKCGIQDLLERGHAEPVCSGDETSDVQWYIPHHVVRHEGKRDRIVFDCAAEVNGMSLNKEVLQGPDLNNHLLEVLLRFRVGVVVILGDIERMFHQIRVPSQHRDVLRFLWQNMDLSLQPDIYRMTVHLFGGIWSPSCAAYVLKRTASDNQDEFPVDVVTAVHENFYVDDLLLSVDSEESAIRIRSQICELLLKGGFRLHKWMSNSRRVLETIPKSERAKKLESSDLDLGVSLPVERALGVQWDAENDMLSLHIKEVAPVCTRRGVLATMSTVYDPLGLVGPYVLRAKLVFQDECRREKAWDDPLEACNERIWLKWLESLIKLQDFSVERCLIPQNFCKSTRVELQIFCDASQKAYGAVCYLRLVNSEGSVHCSFVLAKSRLAPIKQLTLPRLELLAAVLGVQLDVLVRQALKINIESTMFWSDSTIVLQYIRNKSKRFKTFVANRVQFIKDHSKESEWRHVRSEDNPADPASRGLDADQMVSCEMWKKGPGFIWKDTKHWRDSFVDNTDLLLQDDEVKQEVSSHLGIVEINVFEEFLQRYSSWYRLKRAVAWLLRYISWLKNGRAEIKLKPLEVSDLHESEIAILKFIQHKYYEEELRLLSAGKCLPKRSTIYVFEPFVDGDGLLRLGGRLSRAHIGEKARHPVILTKESHVSLLIVRHVHEWETGHSGVEYVLSAVRQRFWITSARPLIKLVLKQCMICRRLKAKPCTQHMSDLPVQRITPGKPPFTYVGVDCFGIFYVKRGRSTEKRYGCLFTCLAVRAIHLEVLHSMDAAAFINAFIRFTSRRGKPECLISDNGTNFVGGEKEMSDMVRSWNEDPKTREHLLVKEIRWDFNPPTASHMGGSWERQIRTVRKVLNAVTKEQIFDDERLSTIFCEVESIVNGRPITPNSDDPRDLEALTPNKLLLLRDSDMVVPGTYGKPDSYGRRWKHVQFVAQQFWKRWVREYLSTLQLRSKWLEKRPNLKTGDLVLMMDESLPRKNWPLARVEDVSVSKDGLVRSVSVRSSCGVYTRPIAKLCLLESVAE